MMREMRGFTRLGSRISQQQGTGIRPWSGVGNLPNPTAAPPLEKRRYFITAFTLIELLVVISVITLLMAILLPVLQRVRNQARAAVCQANLKQWGTVLALYVEDNQGYLPNRVSGWIWLLRGSALSEDDPNKPEIYNKVQTEGIACCPMAVKPSGFKGGARYIEGDLSAPTWQVQVGWGSTFRAWEIRKPGPLFLCSYGFNSYLTQQAGHLLGRGFHPDLRGTDVFSLRRRGSVPTLLDSKWAGGAPRAHDRPPPSDRGGGNTMWCFTINRHNGHVNSLFLDLSVRKVGLKELWTLNWYREFDTAGPWTKAGGVLPQDWPEWMRKFKDY